jgi:hypothetical protein
VNLDSGKDGSLEVVFEIREKDKKNAADLVSSAASLNIRAHRHASVPGCSD